LLYNVLRDDGGLKVMNRGFSPEDKEWKDTADKAYFVGDEDKGRRMHIGSVPRLNATPKT